VKLRYQFEQVLGKGSNGTRAKIPKKGPHERGDLQRKTGLEQKTRRYERSGGNNIAQSQGQRVEIAGG